MELVQNLIFAEDRSWESPISFERMESQGRRGRLHPVQAAVPGFHQRGTVEGALDSGRGRVVLHGFDNPASVQAYLDSDLFTRDVAIGLQPYLAGNPEIRIYSVA